MNIRIKILHTQDSRKHRYYLNRLIENFRSCYTIAANITDTLKDSECIIEFKNPEEVEMRTSAMIELCDYFIRAFTQNDQLNKFDYFIRVLEERMRTGRNDDKGYLIIRYETEMVKHFSPYFSALNDWLPSLNIFAFIEEDENGFTLFFERECDFDDFMWNITSESSLLELLQRRQVQIPFSFYGQIAKIINDKLITDSS